MPALRQHGLDGRSILLHRPFFFFHQLCRSDKSYKVLLWGSDSLLWYAHTWCWGDCARVRFLLGANVNTPSFQLPTPAFEHRCGTRVY